MSDMTRSVLINATRARVTGLIQSPVICVMGHVLGVAFIGAEAVDGGAIGGICLNRTWRHCARA